MDGPGNGCIQAGMGMSEGNPAGLCVPLTDLTTQRAWRKSHSSGNARGILISVLFILRLAGVEPGKFHFQLHPPFPRTLVRKINA